MQCGFLTYTDTVTDMWDVWHGLVWVFCQVDLDHSTYVNHNPGQ